VGVSGQENMTVGGEGINLLSLWRLWLENKFIVAGCIFASVAVAVCLAFTEAPLFRAEVVVSNVNESSAGGGLAALAGQFGGLASLAGVNIGSSGTEREALAVLQSRRLAEEFVKTEKRLKELFPEPKTSQTLWLAVNEFRKNMISIRTDKRTSLTTISIDGKDPAKVALWANQYVVLANEMIRARAIDDANRNIAFLKSQISGTTVVEVQRVMYHLIETETKNLMLASGRAEYAFSVIDPAVTPERRISPKRLNMVLIGLMIGVFLGMFIAFASEGFNRLMHTRKRLS
jgi:uncharacterized protein involved in exopolysaccharide biosynthesis